MNFSTLFSPLTCLLLAGSLYAQRVDTPEVTRNATSTSIQWLSHNNRTYFLQHSTDMLSWSFLPAILSGNGSQLSMGFQRSSPKLFLRLNWTDIPDEGDPNTADFDSDGLGSLEELLASPQTSPLLFDTDGDLLSDGQERALNLNATLADTDGNGTIDSSEDFDGDGLSTLFELTSAIPTNPFAVDSDNDGLNDDVEILLGLNPLLNDTNGDGTLDSEEDNDGDGVNNLIEQNSGSDPSNNSDLGIPPSEGLNEVRYEIRAARITTDARHLQFSPIDQNRFPRGLPFSYLASTRVHFLPTQYIATPASIPLIESQALNTLELESNHWRFLRDEQRLLGYGYHTNNPRTVPLAPFNGFTRTQHVNSQYGITKFRLSRTRPEDTPLQQQFIEISEESPGFTTIEGERQDVTSEAKTFTLTIPAGGTKSTPYTVQAPLKNEVETRTIVLPVEFEIFTKNESREIGGNRSPNWKPHQLNMDTRQKEEEHYRDFDKCVAHIWDGRKLNLAKYLVGYNQNKELFKNPEILNWRVNGRLQEDFELDLGRQPDPNKMRAYRVEVVAKGVASIDHLLVTVVRAATRMSYDRWKKNNQDLSWLSVLPAPYKKLGARNSDPEPVGFMGIPLCNDWVPPERQNSFYHPDSYHEMRARKVGSVVPFVDGPGHQACYSTNGKIILPSADDHISAGSADRAVPVTLGGSTDGHVNKDVLPFIWAAQLDGNPVQGTEAGGFTGLTPPPNINLTAPILSEGVELLEYSRLRPAVANNRRMLNPGECP